LSVHPLVLDHLRRFRLQYLGVVALAATIWLAALQGGMEPQWAMALSLLLACCAGPFAVLFQLPIREFAVLPVSRRDVWGARWMIATIIAAALTATGKSLAIALVPFFWPWLPLRLDMLILSSLVDISLLGVPVALMAWLARRRRRTGRLQSTLDLAAMFGILLAPFLGFALSGHLPVSMDGLARTWWWLVPGIVSFVAIHRHYPANVRATAVIEARPARRDSAQPQALPRRSALAHLSVIVALKAVVPALMGCLIVLLDLFADSTTRNHSGWLILAIVVSAGDWRDRLRQLRLLPLSVSTLIGLMVATSTLAWLCLIGIVATVHAFSPDSSVPPAAAWLLPLIGVSALGEAVTLRFSWTGRFLLLFPGAILLLAVDRLLLKPWTSAHPTLALSTFGGVILLAAIWVFHHALTRSSAPYRMVKYGLPFGAEATRTS
jgi:MFS family permease